ncbi:MAG: hypothetical protein LBN05_00080 [Oscillospiraceae bacterium]|jgi:magnesium transporter|nr:hypothetical protein [Oscillospiraceae bacterium]
MQYFDFSNMRTGKDTLPSQTDSVFVLCQSGDVPALRGQFGWDESTVLECTDLDEAVRYAAFEGYDFVSAVLLREDGFTPEEINVYAAPQYFVLVLPDKHSPAADRLGNSLAAFAAGHLTGGKEMLARLYYMFWQGLLAQYSDVLERLEEAMEALSTQILADEKSDPYAHIDRMRRKSYRAKKYLRALVYIGAQMLTDENELLDAKHGRLFSGIEIRMRRLYGFADNLYALSSELLGAAESRVAMRTNETMNKLTLITLFFAPLTVITGIYGMNFKYMPELNWRFGYPVSIGVLALVCVLLYFIAKKKKWM